MSAFLEAKRQPPTSERQWFDVLEQRIFSTFTKNRVQGLAVQTKFLRTIVDYEMSFGQFADHTGTLILRGMSPLGSAHFNDLMWGPLVSIESVFSLDSAFHVQVKGVLWTLPGSTLQLRPAVGLTFGPETSVRFPIIRAERAFAHGLHGSLRITFPTAVSSDVVLLRLDDFVVSSGSSDKTQPDCGGPAVQVKPITFAAVGAALPVTFERVCGTGSTFDIMVSWKVPGATTDINPNRQDQINSQQDDIGTGAIPFVIAGVFGCGLLYFVSKRAYLLSLQMTKTEPVSSLPNYNTRV
jgi:hypothetical protein